MTGLQKIRYTIIGWYHCISWFLLAFLKEVLPDLFGIPTNPSDFAWYAERMNGRVAMLAVTTILCVDFLTKQSIWTTIHGM